jgi:hypothetical protein
MGAGGYAAQLAMGRKIMRERAAKEKVAKLDAAAQRAVELATRPPSPTMKSAIKHGLLSKPRATKLTKHCLDRKGRTKLVDHMSRKKMLESFRLTGRGLNGQPGVYRNPIDRKKRWTML